MKLNMKQFSKLGLSWRIGTALVVLAGHDDLQISWTLRLGKARDEMRQLVPEMQSEPRCVNHVDQVGEPDELSSHFPKLRSILIRHLWWEP